MADAFCMAVTGAGGAGVMSLGDLLLQGWASAGGRGLLRKAFGPQIRGGEAAALLKLTADERYTAASYYDLLLAFDWNNFARFGDEVRLRPGAVLLCESGQALPDSLAAADLQRIEFPFSKHATAAHPEGRSNMLALGMLGALLDLEASELASLAEQRLGAKAAEYREAAVACIRAGAELAPVLDLKIPARGQSAGWYLSGNQAAAYGALRAGVRFVAAYPITPASDALEYLAAPLERLGGALVQAEDELAAINMVIGAAYGGVPAFTATSGPGLALMSESLGLAVASETPLTVLNVMRGGPSTGIPTKSEQSDLNIAIDGLHGDAPHLVLAPLSVADCAFTTGWAVQLAQRLQVPAIVLSDQLLGQSTAVVSSPRCVEAEPAAALPEDGDGAFLRYRDTQSGISLRAVPGDPDLRFTADGLEHNERGTPSAGADDHQQQLDKRARKLVLLEPGDDWGEVCGDGPLGLLCFGSASAAALAAREELLSRGIECRVIALRLLAPLPVAYLAEALDGCEKLLVIEQNHGAQLLRYLRGELALAGEVHSHARPGPLPLGPESIVDAVNEVLAYA
jgi:2-oxoglutarate ferredoxin oxidoreductase subunit alpha